jgi:hypothetical protein
MGVMDRIRAMFGGSADAATTDANENGLDDEVDEEMAINQVNADVAAEKQRAAERLINTPGME